MKKKELTCKVCNISCKLLISKDNENYEVEGNRCNRGLEFGLKEITEPSRILTGRVILKNGSMGRLPVKTSDVVPSHLIDSIMDIIKSTEVSPPINKGDIIIENILNAGVNVISQRKVVR